MKQKDRVMKTVVFVFAVVAASVLVAHATLTINSNSLTSDGALSLTGTASSTVDLGTGSTLFLQTTSNGPITAGTGLFSIYGIASSTELRTPSSTITGLTFTNATGSGSFAMGSGVISAQGGTVSSTGVTFTNATGSGSFAMGAGTISAAGGTISAQGGTVSSSAVTFTTATGSGSLTMGAGTISAQGGTVSSSKVTFTNATGTTLSLGLSGTANNAGCLSFFLNATTSKWWMWVSTSTASGNGFLMFASTTAPAGCN